MKWAFLLLTLLLGYALQARADQPDKLLGIAYDQHIGAALPADAVLRDETGKNMSLVARASGRPTILALVYFNCPNLCGVVLSDLLSGLGKSGLTAGRDYDLDVVSIDPVDGIADAAKAKAAHITRFPLPGAVTGWHFLTGDAHTLNRIENSVGFASRYDTQLRQFIHPAGIVLLTPAGRVASYLLGVGYRPGDISLGLLNAGRGVLAKPAEPVLLLCFHFDPATGRYSLNILSLLRIMGAVTVATIAVTLYLAFRRERLP